MNRGRLLALVAGLGTATHGYAVDNGYGRFRESHYPSAIYSLREYQGKAPGVYRMKLDNRILEITLPEPAPAEFFMPAAVVTRGTKESDAFVADKLRKSELPPVAAFSATWHYGIFDGAFLSDSAGHISAGMEVRANSYGWVAPAPRTPGSYEMDAMGDRSVVELDYSKLDNFIRAVHSDTNTNPYLIECINGRQWVREIQWRRQDKVLWDIPPKYREVWYTPVDRQRILKVYAGLSYRVDYAIPEEMPDWMQRASRNVTAVLRSIKLSPPDDGSPDPFLIDPEQKLEAEPVTFPARWH